ncbi:MAG: IS110 family transposase [Bryobacterales bacterium]|nr:IS110 family transposase [Bryobacterales bacterium]
MPATNEAAAPACAEHNTLYVAIEISRKSWVVGIKSPASEIGLHSLGPADKEGLRDLIDSQRAKAERALDREVRVLCCYEAGYEGFWLARWLEQEMSIETVVLDPASLLVNRKAKQRKTDRIDAKKMVRALLAHDRGDAAVLSQVRVPSVEEEDRKRLLRERKRLVKEQTSLTNSIKGLLKLHGIFDLNPRAKDFEETFADVMTAYGSPFPPRARQEIERLKERLSLVQRQIAEVEAERDEVARSGAKLSVTDALDGSIEQAAAKIATLTQLKGIGENDATLLTHEVFYRCFRNRRELASWVGLTPIPWASGDTERDQGIGRDGPAWIRANLIQMAWRWLHHQPDSALSNWFERRTAGARGRIRRVMIVALARKLLVALWRFCETGLVPTGARLA